MDGDLERQAEKEMELMEPNFSDAPSFSKTFDRRYAIECAYEFHVFFYRCTCAYGGLSNVTINLRYGTYIHDSNMTRLQRCTRLQVRLGKNVKSVLPPDTSGVFIGSRRSLRTLGKAGQKTRSPVTSY